MVLKDGTLKLIRVMAIDAGEYKCTIANQEGSVEVVITLLVENPAGEFRRCAFQGQPCFTDKK